MNPTHLHLILNHVPVVAAAIGLALFVAALLRKSQELKSAAMAVLVIAAIATVPVYLTGEPAEKGVGPFIGSPSHLIEQHESAAGFAFLTMGFLGALALAGLFVFRRGKLMPSWFASIILGLSLVVASAMAWTAHLGGQIRHPEIRAAASAISPGDHD